MSKSQGKLFVGLARENSEQVNLFNLVIKYAANGLLSRFSIINSINYRNARSTKINVFRILSYH